MADFTLTSFRGGMNDTDAPSTLAPDQVINADNVEFYDAPLGSRRKGCTGIDLTGSGLTGAVIFLHRHLPTTNEADSELWAIDETGAIARKPATSGWVTVTPVDAIDVSGTYKYAIAAQSLHGKLFLAYKSSVDRLHVWDGTTLRRTGSPTPPAPTAANAGSGSFVTTRYYRVRWTVQSGGTTLRRSEPSDTLTFTPSGSGASVTVTRPTTAAAEGATHWELEASLNNVDFYRLATTVVATTTYSDTDATGVNYSTFTLSEDSGDYTNIPSVRYLAADEDRLLGGGSFEVSALASRVSWTPVYADPGVGNDERIPIDTDNFLDLDGFEGGGLTGLSSVVSGYVYSFKQNHIYRLTRTGQREQAYEAILLTKSRGALHRSVVAGVDQTGAPCLYFLDPQIGPNRLGQNGLRWAGLDIQRIWSTVNVNADLVCHGIFYSAKRQMHWWISVNDVDTPNRKIIAQIDQMRDGDDGVRRGWAICTDGRSIGALCSVMYAENVNDFAAASSHLKPIIGVDDTVDIYILQLCDIGNTDSGVAYTASLSSRPFFLQGLLNKSGVMAAVALAAGVAATMRIFVVRDFGLESKSVTIDTTPVGGESHVIVPMDNIGFSECRAISVAIVDTDPPVGQWALHQLSFKPSKGQTA